MDNICKQTALLFSLFLVNCSLCATKSVSKDNPQIVILNNQGKIIQKLAYLIDGYYKRIFNDRDRHCLQEVCYIILRLSLPDDLSYQDCRSFRFTGFNFTHTKLVKTQLENATFNNTTCSYATGFMDNTRELAKKNKIVPDSGTYRNQLWYQNKLYNDLKMIEDSYGRLKQDAHKAELLVIADAISRLPEYGASNDEATFFIILKDCFYRLFKLKKKLKKDAVFHQHVFSLEKPLENLVDMNSLMPINMNPIELEIAKYFWANIQRKDRIEEGIVAKNDASKEPFQEYLDAFEARFFYQCHVKRSQVEYLKGWIVESINVLKKVYHHSEIKFQKEALEIARELAKSPNFSGEALFEHFYSNQRRIVHLEELTSSQIKEKAVYYNRMVNSPYYRALEGGSTQ